MLTINKNVMILMDTLLSFPEIDPTPLYWDRDIAYNNMRKLTRWMRKKLM